MRTSRPALLLFLCSLIPASLWAQQSAPTTATGSPNSQAASILQQALTALTGGVAVTDVTMTGTVTVTQSGPSSVNGSTQQLTTESGTVKLVATASGQSQLTLALPSGNWVTTQNFAGNPRTSTTAGPNGTTQDTNVADMMGPHPAWFYPALLLNAAAPQNYAASYVGQETRGGSTVHHISIWPQSANSSPIYSFSGWGTQILNGPTQVSNLYQGQEELYVDSTSMLPTAIILRVTGSSASNSNPSVARPLYVQEEIDFSGYGQVQGQLAPSHIQVWAGGVSIMDIQISSISLNTGATIAAN